ncbi:MAG: alpha/beta fold hydrolase [Anaerolineales bacterium]|nr:alpha/beta fold hydrolase [Anaerolineales bacterium]
MPIAAGIHYFLHEGGRPTKPPLVLIHGAGGDHLSWPPEIRRLADVRVFTLDLPGHGKSEGPGCQSVADYADSVVGFMNAAGLSRAVLVGHALGGAIALTLAIDHPECVSGIGLISTGPRLPIASSVLENAANPATFILAVQSLQELMHIPQASKYLKDQTFRHLSSIRPTLFHGDLRACDQFDVTTRLDAIRTPVLVLCGTDDQLTPRRYSESLAGQIPGAALQTIDGAGHLVMLEQPRRVSALLSVFLTAIPYLPGM